MTPRAQRDRRGGFTLLELTLATAIVAIVALSLYSAMSVAFRARASAKAQTEAARETSIALDILAADFQSALAPPPTADADAQTEYAPTLAGDFVGTTAIGGAGGGRADRVRFHALGRDADAAASPLGDGARFIELELRTDITPPMLVRRVNRTLLLQGGALFTDLAADATEEPLLGGVRSLELRYHDGYAWLDAWDSMAQGNVLPLAVEITLELSAPAPRRPGEFYRATQVVPLSLGRIADTEVTE